MLKLYQHLFTPSIPFASEEKTSDIHLTERHLQILWLEQKHIKLLETIEGEKIEVISPGNWNMEAGPDFQKAHLRIGQKEYRGDIEIHLKEDGWFLHGHHLDRRYNQVILHLSYWNSQPSKPIYKADGQQAFSCHLGRSISVPMERIVSSIDLDHYPGKQFPTKGRCADHLFQLLEESHIKNFFQTAAYWRLDKKLRFLEQACTNPSMQFAAGIAMALGYKHNAKAFLELFLYLIQYRDLPYEELFAIALGCCGFLEEGRKRDWEQSDYYQSLRRFWWGRKDQATHQAHLKLDHIRPLHHPVRRLAYLSHLLQDSRLDQLWPATLSIWESAKEWTAPAFRKLKDKLLQVLPAYPDSYWDRHYTFESRAQGKVLPGLGNEVKMHFLLNTTLPLLYGEIKESRNLKQWERFQQFYASLEITQNSKSRYLHHRFFGNDKDNQFFTKAQFAQGAYQLHQDFCLRFEASCKGCPFVDRYLAQNGR